MTASYEYDLDSTIVADHEGQSMGILDLLLKPRASAAQKSRLFLTSQGNTRFGSSEGGSSQGPIAVRKDLLRLVLRETVGASGIPGQWLDAQMMRSSSPRRGDGLHVRFFVRHWEPRLLEHAPGFEREFTRRLLMIDPAARDWLHGFSWQFTLPDADAAPPLPHPKSWMAPALRVRVQPRPGNAGQIDEPPAGVQRSAGTARERLAQDFGQRRRAEAGAAPGRAAELQAAE